MLEVPCRVSFIIALRIIILMSGFLFCSSCPLLDTRMLMYCMYTRMPVVRYYSIPLINDSSEYY